MVSTAEIADHVAVKGGPPAYVAQNGDRLTAVAKTLADLALEQQKK
jgi:hypothetical protein